MVSRTTSKPYRIPVRDGGVAVWATAVLLWRCAPAANTPSKKDGPPGSFSLAVSRILVAHTELGSVNCTQVSAPIMLANIAGTLAPLSTCHRRISTHIRLCRSHRALDRERYAYGTAELIPFASLADRGYYFAPMKCQAVS